MNLRIFTEKKETQKAVLIGKTGMLRINKHHSKLIAINKNDRWVCGIDLDENNPANIYIFKANQENVHLGKKMVLINTTWSFDLKPIISEIKLKIPLKCKFDLYDDNHFEGFKLKIS